ncbi:LacI family DNA-binding transcriptional regulator [Actinotalea fermentans]|uniref:Transcriptional regulator n=1 Tax=Actinotalea fermentans TaxID=43671 RepID=A0A511YXZ7_9CELL|nr:LacI family DNA-binding transcriptional regulator [Actinotalea fermentans]KGM14853.1 LacI family transcriptional regulator [Actinotalea fermentans ATCC 43279 = JCM 9966 = DSM 3133]GEN80059.1 transcriptional regulator [Actinotalea fermentans]
MARVTLQTIAEQVGVSRMTVSNAFSRPDQLSAALRETILATAAELGYVGPDPAARALAKGTTGAVGILLTNSMGTAFRDDVATSFFGAVAEELAPTGLAVTLLPLYGSAESIPARDVPIDGALVYACPDGAPALDWLVRRRLPLVFVDREPTPGAASVTLDERGGGRQGAEHLLSLGHRHVGLLTSSFEGPHGIVPDVATAGGDFVARERIAAWTQTLGAAGVRMSAVQVRENTDREGYEGARLLLDTDDRPTGILCFSDTLAWGAVRAAQDLDLRVPQDVSVIGFDDAQIARRARPALTTVRQDVVAKGRAAAAQLTAAIARHRDGSGDADDAVHVVLPTELVVRHSTGPAPA